jgi:hypothetical protein
MAVRTARMIPITEAARRARCSPRQMRRRLQALGGKVLVRHSDAPRAKLWVDLKELGRTRSGWLEVIDAPLTEARVREIVERLLSVEARAIRRDLEKILQRVLVLEEFAEDLRRKEGRRRTK